MSNFIVSAITWVLEFLCITFGCTDYLEAIACLPFLFGVVMGVVLLIIAFERWASKVVQQIRLVRKLDRMAELMITRWQEAVFDLCLAIIDALYVEVTWHIKHKLKKLGQKVQYLEQSIRRLDKK